MMTEQEIKFSFYSGLYATQPEKQISLDDLYQLTVGNLLKFKTLEVRRLTLEGCTKEADSVKKSLPVIAVGGHFDKRRRAECLVEMTGFMLVDIDDARRTPISLVAQCRTLPYVAFASVSVRGGGVHLLVRIGKVAPEAYKAVCLEVSAAISRLTGEKVDEACFDLPRTMLLSYDPDCYMNPAVVPFEVPVPEEAPPATPCAGSRASGFTSSQRLTQYLDKADLSFVWVKGSRHTTLTSLAGCLNLAGFDEDSAAAECVHRYAAPDFSETEIRRTIASIYAAGRADFGRNEREKGTKNDARSATSANGAIQDDDVVEMERNISENKIVKGGLSLIPDAVYDEIPPFLSEILAHHVAGRERDVELLSILTILSSVTPNVSGSYNEHLVYPPLFSVIVGEPGSGKGVMSKSRELVQAWQRYIRDTSNREMKEYEKKLLAYARDLSAWQKKGKGSGSGIDSLPEKPYEVLRKELHMSGDTSKPRMIEQLSANGIYSALLQETEMSVLTTAMQQDYGKYIDVLNRVAHHEEISNDFKSSGSHGTSTPLMAVLLSGTPNQLPGLWGNMNDGFSSRFQAYMIPEGVKWKKLTDKDDTRQSANHYLQFGERVMEMGMHLEKYPTWIRFTKAQRKEMNRVFEDMVNRAYQLGSKERQAFIFRSALSVFRISMTLTAIRKFERLTTEDECTISDADFRTAMAISGTTFNHLLIMCTLLPCRNTVHEVDNPNRSEQVFLALPNTFLTDTASAIGKAHCAAPRTITRWLAMWLDSGLIERSSKGCYSKTRLGKRIVKPKGI